MDGEFIATGIGMLLLLWLLIKYLELLFSSDQAQIDAMIEEQKKQQE